MDIQAARQLITKRPHWYHRFEIFPGVITPGVYDPSGTLHELKLAPDLKGKTVLEIGPAEGYFTKKLSERGAEVTAVDYAPKYHHGFGYMEEASGRQFHFIQSNVYDLEKTGLETFDIVLCLGVLYHLPDPVRALWTLRKFVKEQFILETLICREHEDEPFAKYLPWDSSNGDITNFWSPNPKCTQMMLEDAGFIVEKVWLNDTRGMFHCRLNNAPGAMAKMDAAYAAPNWA